MKSKVILQNSFTFVLALTLLSPIIFTISANVFIVMHDFIAAAHIDETLPLISQDKYITSIESIHQIELFQKHTKLKNVIVLGIPETIPWNNRFDEFLFNIGLSGPNYDLETFKFYHPTEWLLLDYNPTEKTYADFLIPNKTLTENFIHFKDKSHTFSYCGFEEPIKNPKKKFFLLVGKYKPIHAIILKNMPDDYDDNN